MRKILIERRLKAAAMVLAIALVSAGMNAVSYAQGANPARSPLRLQPKPERAEQDPGVSQITLPRGDQSNAFDQIRAMPQAASSVNWTPIGPAPIASEQLLGPNGYCDPRPAISASGRATAIAFGAGGAIYYGTAGGGVWKSTNGGSSWKPLTDGQPSLSVGAIAVVAGATTAQDVVYVGTGESNQAGDNQYGQGILKSVDGGTTWTQLALATFNYQTFGRIAVVPGTGGNPDTLYAATATGVIGAGTARFAPPAVTAGVYKSVNGGVDWKLLSGTGGLPTGFTGRGTVGNGGSTDIAVDPANPSNVYAAIVCKSGGCDNGGIWKSPDAGVNWQQLTNGIPAVTARISLWMPNSSTLYAANTVNGDDFDALYISNNVNTSNPVFRTGGDLPQVGGRDDCLSTGQADYNLAIGGDPSNPNTVYLGLIGLYRSTNGGDTFQYVIDQAHPDFHAVGVSNGVVYALNDGGLSTSTNGVNWSATINNGLATLLFQGAALGPQGNAIIAGGMQDNDLAVFSGNPIWTSSQSSGDSGLTAISPGGGAVFGEQQKGSLIASTSNGAVGSFKDIPPDLDTGNGEKSLFYAPLNLDPSNGDRLLFGTYRVWQTCTAGGTASCDATSGNPTWTPISQQLNPGCTFESEEGPIQLCLITDVRVAPSNPAVMYAVTDSLRIAGPFAWVSQNSNALSPTFTNISEGLPKGRPLTSVAISPVDPAVVVVSVNGFTDGGKHIYESTRSGDGWTDITPVVSGYPNLPTLKVLFDANDTTGHTILAGTSEGILRTADNGATWQSFNPGFPLAQTFDLEQNPEFLLAATHGRGVWIYQTAVTRGDVSVTPASSSGGVGKTVAAGSITVDNNTSSPANLRAVTVTLSEPSVVESMSLEGAGATATVSPVSSVVTFNFQTPGQIAANSSVTFDLRATLAPGGGHVEGGGGHGGGGHGGGGGRPGSAKLGHGGLDGEGRLARMGVASIAFALAALGMILLAAPIRVRRLIPITATVLILGAILMQAGCGGGSSGGSSPPPPVRGTSEQNATQVWVSSAGGSLAVTGLPASLGTVSVR